MNKEYDVIIVGAGPAGCSAAISLARRGCEILLLEKEGFPRGKVCGDGIGPPALEVLERLGILSAVRQNNPWKIEGLEISSPAGQILTVPFFHLKSPCPFGLVIPRREFDFLLSQQVRKYRNLEILENWEVKDFIGANGNFKGVRAQCEGQKEEFFGKVLIGSDGAYSVVARKLVYREREVHPAAFGLRAYFRGVKDINHRIEIHCDRSILPGYGWLFPTGEDSANVGVGIGARHLRGKNIRNLFRAFVERNPFVNERLRDATMVQNSLQGGPIPAGSFFRRRYRKNVLLVGDAGGFTDVLTGEGIYFALRSGECAAEAIHAAFNAQGGMERVGKIYESLWRSSLPRWEFLYGSLLKRLILREFFLNRNIARALKKPSMARDLASILCHEKSKIALLF
ncbi:MAG: geranylgeranyl reductase family protein [Syntrophaceae bacterium]|nr:geranylgeranyl reductase family protein [Syntrophaceae bacterium]